MNDAELLELMRAAVDAELRSCVDLFFNQKPQEFKEIVEYQMGWEKNDSASSTGKRLRPTMLLATYHALGMDWQKALPAAAAIELVHNFSLVHDDIQDRSETRRGKPALWVKWGEAQAINVGDAILATAFMEIQHLDIEEKLILKTLRRLISVTLDLTTGQYLDLAFEKAESISFSAYWDMVKGKTGALFGACFALAGILAGEKKEEIDQLEAFGNTLGLAFQVQDDYLGIFGDVAKTGKSAAGDLIERKKTFPIIYGLTNLTEFRDMWIEHAELSENEVVQLKGILEENGVREISQEKARELYAVVENDFLKLFQQSKSNLPLHGVIENLFERFA